MTSALAVLADVGERLETALGQTVDIALQRLSTVRSTVTGNFGYLPAVTVKGRIEGADLIVIRADGSIKTAKHRITLWTPAGAGDRLIFAASYHEVLELEGVFRAMDGSRYRYDLVTN